MPSFWMHGANWKYLLVILTLQVWSISTTFVTFSSLSLPTIQLQATTDYMGMLCNWRCRLTASCTAHNSNPIQSRHFTITIQKHLSWKDWVMHFEGKIIQWTVHEYGPVLLNGVRTNLSRFHTALLSRSPKRYLIWVIVDEFLKV